MMQLGIRGAMGPWIAAGSIALAAAGCGGKGGGPQGGMAVPVVAVKAASQPVAQTLSVVGSLEANEAVEVRAEIDGTIQAITFEEGQPVAKGQPLVQIDTSKLEASLAQAAANLTLAEATRRRYEGLIEAGAVSRQEFDQALATFSANEAAVALIREQLQDANIVAPFEGVIGGRQVSAGQYVTAGTPLTWLIDGDPMKVSFRVPERSLGQIAIDQEAQVSVDAYPKDVFAARVYFVDPVVDAATRTALIKALVPNPDGRLRPGMFADVTLTLDVRPDAVVIPETAVIHDDQRTSVFVVEQDQAQPRAVRLGRRLPGQVEILEGLAAGEVVVIEGIQKLGPGSKVMIRAPEAAPAATP
jgi:membrane fusion protein (multidrug efflux system)